MKRTIKKTVHVILALLCLVIGSIGVVIPVLPTTPFLLASSFFFARGSDRFNKWFLSARLYKNHLEDFVQSRKMTLKNKIRILVFASCMLVLGMYFAKKLYARLIIGGVLVYKYYYFINHIETTNEEKKENRR